MQNQQDHQLHALLIDAMDTMAVAVSVIDAAGTLVYYNAEAARLLDRKPEYIGTDIRSHHKKASSNAAIDRMLDAFARGRTEPFIYEAKPYGKPIAVTVSPIFRGTRFIGCTQSVRPLRDR